MGGIQAAEAWKRRLERAFGGGDVDRAAASFPQLQLLSCFGACELGCRHSEFDRDDNGN